MALGDLRLRAQTAWAALQHRQQPVVLVGTATCGRSAGSLEVLKALQRETADRGLECDIVEVGCLGLCYAEPLVCVAKPGLPGICYGDLTPKSAAQLVKKYLIGGDPLPAYALGTLGEGRIPGIPQLYETPVLKPQVRRVLRNCGIIDPENLDHYLARGGYTGLEKALATSPEQIIDALKRAGLRGRGGAGFPTWRKWQFCRAAPGDAKYLICNADEGDPGAFMNRSLIEGDPHSLIEGMLIAGYALGAGEAYIYCRAEYPLALERLGIALGQAEACGLLGADILGSGFSFHIKVKEGAGAFVCGEETALIASIEGERGMPRPRPPFPAVSGLWGKPTVINNVETLASVALIMQHGAEWFAQCGTETSKGTKTFSLVGKVKRTGLVEVPLGITLREIIFGIGGGILDDKEFKAVQTGGPSGGCIPAELLDMPVDYDSLKAVGSIMGSGGMVVMDEDTCMVDVARYFLDFTQKESCGKCGPCRLGTRQMLDILRDITSKQGQPEDLDLLVYLGQGVKAGSLCGLGQTAPNPVLTTLRYFRPEYEAHIAEERCPAKMCREFIYFRIIPEQCVGCRLCAKACPKQAIEGEMKKVHLIDQSQCIHCGMCFEACPPRIRAVERLTGREVFATA
ncbi:MAG: NADH-quinone oxidoreductase subunit NuoF [Candidatus Latescibacteria bacterium]|nr:NADH-quinone oxidoreductase subunit NuoF [Candidatus Latescibacterota bacterium]